MGIVAGLASLLGTFAGASGQVIFALVLSSAALTIAFLSQSRDTKYMLTLAGGVCILCALLATIGRPTEGHTVPAPGKATFRAEVVSDPRIAGQGTSAEVKVRDGPSAGLEPLAFFPASFPVAKGSEIFVIGEFPDTTGSIVFVDQARIEQRPTQIERLRGHIRNGLVEQVQAGTPGSPGTLTVGLLTGDDSALTPSERDDLRHSGLSHITAVSGWNVTVVVGTVALVFRAAGLRGRFWTVVQIVGILLYVWLVGLQPPIVRAAIMGSIALLATWFGRPAHAMTLLVLTAAVMAVLEPAILWSVSFQLSFLAMVGVAMTLIVTAQSEGLKRVVLSATLAPVFAAIATTPLIAVHFGMISLLTVPANTIVAPLISPMALMGFLGAVMSMLHPAAGVLPGSAAWILGSIVLTVSGMASWVPGASTTFRPPEPGAVVGIYLILLVLASPWIPEIRHLVRRGQEALARRDSGSLVGVTSFSLVLLAGWLMM